MSRKRLVVLLGLLCVFGSLTVAFQLGVVPRNSTTGGGAETPVGRTTERGNFNLRVAVVGPLEPFSALGGSSFMTAAQELVFDTFLMPDERGSLMSRVLRRWERIDSRHYRVQLDPNLRFSDGAPVSIQDAIASLAAQRLRGKIHGEWLEIEPLNPHEFVEPSLLYTILYKQTEAGPLGTGPFRLVSESQVGLALERIQPLPRRIKRVEILAFPTPGDVLARVLRGDTNAAFNLDEYQLELTADIPRLKPIRNLVPNALVVVFNPRRLNPETRRRLAAVLPVSDIARVFGESCRVEESNGNPSQSLPLPPGPRLEVLMPKMTVSTDRAALAVRRALGRRGGEIVRVNLPEIGKHMKVGSFDVIVATFVVWPDYILADAWKTGAPGNLLRYSNRLVDAAFERGDFAAARAELKADVAFVEICRRERIGVVDSRIKNPRMGWWGWIDTLPDWEVEE